MADPRGYTPRHLERGILDRRSARVGERKHVTVLFADVARSLELAERFDPEQWHLLLDRFFRVLTEGVHRYEGTVNQYTGDGVMALFGAPLAHEDHAQRAVSAALHLRGQLTELAARLGREHGIEFGVRMGLNSGEVVVGRIGDDLRMDYTAQGRVVGTAERIQERAVAGEVLLSHHTASLVAGYCDLEPLGPLRLRGLETPVPVFRLRGSGPLRTRLDAAHARGFSRFVGRDAEMAALAARFEQARRAQGGVVGVVGDAGVGKSRLCREFASLCAASGAEIGPTQALAHARNVPLLPILSLLRGQLGIREGESAKVVRGRVERGLRELDPALCAGGGLLCEFLGLPADPARPPSPPDPAERQRAVSDLLERMLAARSRLRPAVYLIEDLQWLDAASERFVDQLARACAGTRTLLLVNMRPGYRAPWMDAPDYAELPLAALAEDDIARLLRDLLGAELAVSELADRIRERSRGNPFFIEEIVHSLVLTGALQGARGARQLRAPATEIALPPTVHALLAARIDRLAESDKGLLEHAAVIGVRFSRRLLARVAGRDAGALDADLLRLVDAELIRDADADAGGHYAFCHPLIHEVAYGTQLVVRRRRAHADVAAALQAEEPERSQENAARIAEHRARAGEVGEAVAWHERAACSTPRAAPSGSRAPTSSPLAAGMLPAVIDFNPFAYAFHEDPYPIYARLRAEAPVYRNEALGFFAFSRHADVLAAFKDWRSYSNRGGVSLEQLANDRGDVRPFLSMLGMDPPEHDALRALVSKAFTPRRVLEQEPRIRALARRYVDGFSERGACDFIAEFAGKLPMDVVSEMLGVPESDRDELRAWSDAVLHREEGVEGLPPSAIQAAAKLAAYYAKLVAERRRRPGADLVSALLAAELEGARLEDRDVIGFLFLMIVAGNETTTKLLGNALYWLARHPDQRERLRRQPERISGWIEETLRYDNSTQLLARRVIRDHEVRGVRLREGDKLVLLVGSANRDEEVWERPDVYDIGRDTTQSLSFGRGTHFCLGAALARLEALVSLEEIWARLSDYAIDEAGLVRVHSTNVRGFSAMPIAFTPSRRLGAGPSGAAALSRAI